MSEEEPRAPLEMPQMIFLVWETSPEGINMCCNMDECTGRTRSLSFHWQSTNTCTLTLHSPLEEFLSSRHCLAQVASFPTNDFAYGPGTFSGRCQVSFATQTTGYREQLQNSPAQKYLPSCLFIEVAMQFGKWTSAGHVSTADIGTHNKSNSIITIEGNFTTNESLKLMRSEARTFSIAGRESRFFLHYAVGSFDQDGHFQIESEVWSAPEENLEATCFLGSPEWWSLKSAANLQVNGRKLPGVFVENIVSGSEEDSEILWQSHDEEMVMTQVENDIYHADRLPFVISGVRGEYSGHVHLDPPALSLQEGTWKMLDGLHAGKEVSVKVLGHARQCEEGLVQSDHVPMHMTIANDTYFGFFCGEHMLNASQDSFVAAGQGEWIEQAKAPTDSGFPAKGLQITGTWTISDRLIYTSQLTSGRIEGHGMVQEGEWRDNCLWNGNVENGSGSPLLQGDWAEGKYTGGVRDGAAYGTGVYLSEFCRFEGQWDAGQPHGRGKEGYLYPKPGAFHSTKGTYYGTWIHGKRVGTGIFVWPDDVVTCREYSDGVLVCERNTPVPPEKVETMKSLYC